MKYAEMFEKGGAGERAVARILDQLPGEWLVLNDVRWPGRQRATIDHVIIGPNGVYVIDAKNWSGAVDVSNGVLRQNGYNRNEAVVGARAAAAAIAAQLPPAAAAFVFPVVCFAGEAQAAGEAGGVILTALDGLFATVTTPRVHLTPDLLQLVRFDLDLALVAASSSRRLGAGPMPSLAGPSLQRHARPSEVVAPPPRMRPAPQPKPEVKAGGRHRAPRRTVWSGLRAVLGGSTRRRPTILE